MRVIRNEGGWDIALDLIFRDRATAETIAGRIQPVVHALLREAIDVSLLPREVLTPPSAKAVTIQVPHSKPSTSSVLKDKGAETEPWWDPTSKSNLKGRRSDTRPQTLSP